MDRLKRGLLVAAPFALLAGGAWTLVSSPWPTIFGLMMRGQRVVVAQGWGTSGQLILAIVCFVAALAVSFNIKRR